MDMSKTSAKPGRPSGQRRRAVRQQLLEAARELFTRHGFEGVSTRRLAREADTTPAMIHYYFEDKHGLFRALIEEMFEPRLEALEGSDDDRPLTLADFVRTQIAMFHENPWMPALVFREVIDGDEGYRTAFAQRVAGRLFPILNGAIRSEIAKGELRADLDPVAVIISAMSLCVYPFLARPIIEAGLGQAFDDAFIERWQTHAVRMLYEGLAP